MKERTSLLIPFFVITAILLAACGGSSGGESAAVDAGKKLFEQPVIGSQAGCVTCHSTDPGLVLVGPSLAGVGSRVGSTVPGMSAEDYLRESIQNPDAHIAEGFTSGVMVKAYGDELSDEQVNDLVAYLLTLK